MRLGHARGLACAKTKKFPCIFLTSPPHPSAAKRKRNGKEIFGFASLFQSPKRAIFILTFLFALFSALTATKAPCYPRLVVIRNSVPLTANSDKSSKWSLAIQNSLRNGKAQILYVFALPSQRTHPPCRF